MSPSNGQDLVYDVRMSSVVPASITGGNVVHQLSNMDLAMKLHYLRAVYYFKSDAMVGHDILSLKKPMFKWLDIYCSVAGRIRRSESGRPFIKCNDAGVRIFEAMCRVTVDEWLEMDDPSRHKLLVSNQVLGPQLQFSPLVYVQFTWFRCGGISVGLSWSHLIGDIFTASIFMNMWGQIMAGEPSIKTVHLPRTEVERPTKPASNPTIPLSVKQVNNIGDEWLPANACTMSTCSFHITDIQLKHLRSKISYQTGSFEAISALFWQCVARIREEKEPKMVTVCRNDSNAKGSGILINNQVISTVKTDSHVANAELSELAALIAGGTMDESKEIEEMVESDDKSADLIIYGANLTFVNLEGVDCYGLEMKGQKPISVYFGIDGVGDEGTVLVLPGPVDGGCDGGAHGGRMVTVILLENQVSLLRKELEGEWCAAGIY
ncbi:protein ECERIFERUM 2-like [Magnolia sinica]|uniref:protein ECERIFERUM 2-like n=1 Tax=Magnolia sinica TaxID=86752 RepID=UPI0026582919|nr:protein ECERIFERUM 2-like [Magnolia sinica]